MDNKTYEEDFKMIRSAIDGAKNPMNQLGGFFKSYAIINMITVVLYLIVSLYQGFVLEMLMNLQVFSAIILLSVSFLIVSFVRDNKIYAVCAIGNLVVYLIAFAIDQELSIGNIVIHYQDLYYYVMLIIGYMILAKCIRKE